MSLAIVPTRDLSWLTTQVGPHIYFSPDARAIQAVDAQGAVMGMLVYDHWTENSVQVSIALAQPRVWWALAKPAFRYPFEECGKGVLLAIVNSDNERSMRLTRGVGFREKCRVKDGVKVGVDSVLFEMRRESCGWLMKR